MRRPFRMPLTVLPVLVFISALVIQGLILWVDTRTRVEQLHTEVEVSAQQAGLRLQTWLNDRIAIGNFLVSHVENHHTEPAQYLADAEALLNSFGGVQAINWVNPDGTIAFVYPRDGNEAALGQDLYTHPNPSVGAAIRRATVTRQPSRTSATVELLQGGRGFAAYFPAERDTGELIGFINVVFRVSDVVERCLDDAFLASFRSAAGRADYFVQWTRA